MRREAAAAALVGDLKGTAGTSTWLIGIVAVWRNRASRRGDWVGDGAVTEEAMRFSLTENVTVHSSKSQDPNSGTDRGRRDGETALRN